MLNKLWAEPVSLNVFYRNGHCEYEPSLNFNGHLLTYPADACPVWEARRTPGTPWQGDLAGRQSLETVSEQQPVERGSQERLSVSSPSKTLLESQLEERTALCIKRTLVLTQYET